ncbi:hypothetical protein WR25_08895 [Diploscapter pachys]|uniref:Uncharacterized protein n=1 Tax=Diploscapter pachys TaxID=2018661 RepID=A0A2A2JAZ6_9BILA|nr:hypothetical protein WR25_08895 [Diploscapter pachys]
MRRGVRLSSVCLQSLHLCIRVPHPQPANQFLALLPSIVFVALHKCQPAVRPGLSKFPCILLAASRIGLSMLLPHSYPLPPRLPPPTFPPKRLHAAIKH